MRLPLRLTWLALLTLGSGVPLWVGAAPTPASASPAASSAASSAAPAASSARKGKPAVAETATVKADPRAGQGQGGIQTPPPPKPKIEDLKKSAETGAATRQR